MHVSQYLSTHALYSLLYWGSRQISSTLTIYPLFMVIYLSIFIVVLKGICPTYNILCWLDVCLSLFRCQETCCHGDEILNGIFTVEIE